MLLRDDDTIPPRGSQRDVFTMVFFDPTRRRSVYVVGAITCTVLVALLISSGMLYYLRGSGELYARAPAQLAPYRADEKTIALSFDDGPDPTYTPRLVQLLKQENVTATFFLVGEHVLKYPHIAASIVENGFEIGNHSFSHEESVHASEERIRHELVATDHAIVAATGHSAMLYRPPFLMDVKFGIPDGRLIENENLRTLERFGTVVVSADIDTTDWEKESVNDAEEIYDILVTGVAAGKHVVLLHDHGGSGATVEALKKFIPEMKAAGYTFVPVSQYFGLTREQAMPRVEMSLAHSLVTSFLSATTHADVLIHIFGVIVGILGLMRMWLIFTSFRFFVPRQELSRTTLTTRERIRPFTVIIPAYNEEANIIATLHSIVASSVIPTQIVVVDDGSTDRTYALVRTFPEHPDLTLELIRKENGGTKTGALRYGLAHAQHDIVMCIDADTIVEHHSFEYLLTHFNDEKVGAVAGKIYPATTTTLIEKLQYLEYIQGQNLDKKVLALGNSVGIVPGAIGAWRTRAIDDVGGYSNDTVVEDQDLTLALLSRGWKVNYEPLALAYTETPATIRSFFSQRFRWMYGTVQCFYKYDRWMFSTKQPWLGFVVLPNTLIFSIILPLTAPFFDAFAIAGILGLVHVPVIVTTFCLLVILDLWFAYEALKGEPSHRFSWLPLVIIQRLFYQYVAFFAVTKSIGIALSGSMVRWGALTRRGAATEALAKENISPALQPEITISFEPRRAIS